MHSHQDLYTKINSIYIFKRAKRLHALRNLCLIRRELAKQREYESFYK